MTPHTAGLRELVAANLNYDAHHSWTWIVRSRLITNALGSLLRTLSGFGLKFGTCARPSARPGSWTARQRRCNDLGSITLLPERTSAPKRAIAFGQWPWFADRLARWSTNNVSVHRVAPQCDQRR